MARTSLHDREREAVPEAECHRIAGRQIENRRVMNHQQLIALDQRANVAKAQQGPAARRARQRPLFPQRAVPARTSAIAHRPAWPPDRDRTARRATVPRRRSRSAREFGRQLVCHALNARHALRGEFPVDCEPARPRGIRGRTGARSARASCNTGALRSRIDVDMIVTIPMAAARLRAAGHPVTRDAVVPSVCPSSARRSVRSIAQRAASQMIRDP